MKMSKRYLILCLSVCIVLFAPLTLTAKDDFIIQVRLFHGTWTEGQAGPQRAEVLTTLSQPELSSIKDNLTRTVFELKVAVIDTLLKVYGLSTLDDIFLHNEQWNGLGKPALKDKLFGESASYEITLSPRTLSSQQISLHLDISGGETNPANYDGDFESIFDQDLILDVDDPVIISKVNENEAHFVMVVVTRGTLDEKEPRFKKADEVEFVPAPRALKQVQPIYPSELRRRRIGGIVGLRITIDMKGNVQNVAVVKPNHPYHNYSAVQAILHWKFEPVLNKEKPIPAMFFYAYKFDPVMYRRERTWSDLQLERPDSSSQNKLRKILLESGDYCQNLSRAVYDFICEETIVETHYNLLNNIRWASLAVGPRRQSAGGASISSIKPSTSLKYSTASESRSILNEAGGEIILSENLARKPTTVAKFQLIDPKRTIRNKFLCDYQIMKKANSIKEQRIVLKENGRKTTEKKDLLEEKRFSGINSLFALIRIFAKERQSRFVYRIIDEKKIHGQMAYVVEALPKVGYEDEVWSARIWLDKKSFQIRKCEIEGIPIDGYEDVLNDCAILNIKPIFLTTYEYRTEKNKILFPSRSEIRVAYPGVSAQGTVPKIKMDLIYNKFKFFTVETDHKVIKKISDNQFSPH
jgi:TonB family protein